MLRILYSYNKRGFEADYWEKEIAAASTPEYQFIPFNHEPYLSGRHYVRAQLLDDAYYQEHPGLMRLYGDVRATIKDLSIDALLVDNGLPYHPDWLRSLDVYKVMRTTDGPMTAYDRDFAYVHAYDHVLYHSPAYSRDMGMEEKLLYCGAKRADFWPLASFDALCDPSKTESDILSHARDLDVVFVGALHLNKMPLLAAIKKALGSRLKLHGVASAKKNAYFNVKYGFPGWVSPIAFDQYVPLYQRTKIGINVHNRGDYTVGGFRLFDLPANGVMQISDGGRFLDSFYDVGNEVVAHRSAEDLIEKVEYYLANDSERERIALNGFRRVQKDYKIGVLLQKAGRLIEEGQRSAV